MAMQRHIIDSQERLKGLMDDLLELSGWDMLPGAMKDTIRKTIGIVSKVKGRYSREIMDGDGLKRKD